MKTGISMSHMKFKNLRLSTFLYALLIFLVAISIRMVYLYEIRDNPFFENLTLDQTSYDRWALRIARGDWLGKDIFYQDPLYPYFLGALYSIIGRDLFWVRVAQAAVGSLTCVLIFVLGNALFSRRAGLLAGAIAAIYKPFFYFDALIEKTFLGVFLVCLFLALLIHARPRRSFLLWISAGLVLGLLALVRANALAFVAGVLAWLFLVEREQETRSYKFIAMGGFLAGLLLVLFTVCARNYIVGKDFVLLTSQAGQNFYIGNNPLNTSGRYHPPNFIRPNPRYEQEDFRVRAEIATGRTMKPSEISSYWFGEAFRFIEREPVKWLKLMAKKFWLFWNWYEAPDNQNYYFFSRYSMLQRLPLPDFRFVAAFALAGMAVFLPQWKRLFLLYATVLLYSGAVIAFYIFDRYRLPVVPALILFAAFAICELAKMAVQRKWWKSAASAALSAVFAFLISTDVNKMDYYGDSANAYCRLAAVEQTRGDLDAALAGYRQAIEVMPHYWAPYYGLGEIYSRRKEIDLALENYTMALAYSPQNPEIYTRLGYLYYTKGLLDKSIEMYQEAVKLKPDWDKPHYWLATIYEMQGQHEQAKEHARRFHELTITSKNLF
jgi:tetratricopeptide (TPR) repeat protein